MTETPTLRVISTTTHRRNNDLSLQLLKLYATSSAECNALVHVASRRPLPTFEEFVHALVRLRN